MDKRCEYCGVQFKARRSILRFCSCKCSAMWRGANHPTPITAFKPGMRPWNAGTNQSGMSGKEHSDEAKNRIKAANSGPNAPNWKGGVTSEHYRLRRSAEYARWRKAVFERDNYTCQHCFARSVAGGRIRIEADHILPFAAYKNLRFEVSNGRTLCESCHRKTPTWGVAGHKAVLMDTGETFAQRADGQNAAA